MENARRQPCEVLARAFHFFTILARKYVGRIGERAGVVVDPERGKYASAHDLRRAFDHRRSRQVMPAVLKELMRHSSIETTMTYYVGQNAQATAELWRITW